MSAAPQFLAPTVGPDEDELERSLRPRSLDDFVGQSRVKEQLSIALQAARTRGEPLDHVLLVGPPGLGKTSLSFIIREELGVGIRTVAGPGARAEGRPGGDPDRARDARRPVRGRDPPPELRRRGGALPGARGLPPRHHRRPGPAARTLTLDVAVHARRRHDPYRAADDAAPRPLRDDLPAGLLRARGAGADRAALRGILGVEIGDDAAEEIARRSRGTPRVANRILRRVRDVAEVRHQGVITPEIAREALELLEVDGCGLERTDRALLRAIVERFDGGPVGLSTLAVALGEEPDTVEDVYEPYLLQLGFIQRTPRGRIVTKLGRKHLGSPRRRAGRRACSRPAARSRSAQDASSSEVVQTLRP